MTDDPITRAEKKPMGELTLTWETEDDTYSVKVPRCTGVSVTTPPPDPAEAFGAVGPVIHLPVRALTFKVTVDHRLSDGNAYTITRTTKELEP